MVFPPRLPGGRKQVPRSGMPASGGISQFSGAREQASMGGCSKRTFDRARGQRPG